MTEKYSMNSISSLRTVNGVAVEDMETPLDKSHLKQGDKVTLDFDGNVFSGVIDFECSSPSESLRREPGEHLESPSKTSGVGSLETAAGVPLLEEVPPSASRKRKSGPAANAPEPNRKPVEKKQVRIYMYTLSIKAAFFPCLTTQRRRRA